jgi:hypothetical protein
MLFVTHSSDDSKVVPCTPATKAPRWDNRYRFADPNGVTYFPIVETWFFLVALLALLVYFSRCLYKILLRNSTSDSESPKT